MQERLKLCVLVGAVALLCHAHSRIWFAGNYIELRRSMYEAVSAQGPKFASAMPSRPFVMSDFEWLNSLRARTWVPATEWTKYRALRGGVPERVDIVRPAWKAFVFGNPGDRLIRVSVWEMPPLLGELFALGSLIIGPPLVVLIWLVVAFTPRSKMPASKLTDIAVCICIALAVLLPLPAILALFSQLYSMLPTAHPNAVWLTEPGSGNLARSVLMACLLGLYPLVYLHLRWRHAAKGKPGHPTICGSCGYERGPLDACPECGSPRDTPPTKLSKTKRRILIAGYAGFPLLLLAPFWISWIDIGLWHLRN